MTPNQPTPDITSAGAWEHSWRAVDIEQRVLESARVSWQRCVDQDRHDANDRANQLKNLARLSAIIAGFSMSAFLEFNFDPSTVPTGLCIVYGITTAAVAAIYMGCMGMCNLLLSTVLQVGSSYVTEEEESHFMLHCREFAIRYRRGDRPPAPPRSFRRLWDFRCASAWRITLVLFAVGVPMFLANMAVASWIKFAQYKPGAAFMTAIMAAGLAYMTFTFGQWFAHLVQSFKSRHQEELWKNTSTQHELANSIAATLTNEPQGLPWDWHLEPVIYPRTLQFSAPVTSIADKRQDKADDRAQDKVMRWRQEDMEQQHLDNALVLWNRFLSHLRTEVNERAEQLRSLSFLAGILLSFSMAALYQLNFTVTAFPNALNIMYALTVGLTVALNLCSLTVCGFLNMGIVKVGASLCCQEEQAHFLGRCQRFATAAVASAPQGARPPRPLRTFGSHWIAKCEGDWKLAFATFTLGAVVFQMCLVFSAWLKFAPYPDPSAHPPQIDHTPAAVWMTVILGLGIVYFCYISIRWARRPHGPKEERIKWGSQPPSVGLPFDWHLPPTKWDKPPLQTAAAAGDRSAQSLPFSPSPESPYAALLPGSLLFRGMYTGMDEHPWHDAQSWGLQAGEQRHLHNALSLWKRFTDKNLNDLEERQEQLKAVTELAAIISGFEMIAFLQFQFDTTQITHRLQLAYVATSGFTVALMACSMTMCGFMLESILESSSEFVGPAQEADFIAQCRQFCNGHRLGDRPPAPRRSFKAHWDSRCENEWRRAFYMFSLGVPLFLANAAVSSWIKFINNKPPGILVTVMQGLAIVYLAFSHARWVKHLLGSRIRPSLQDTGPGLAPAGLPFDWHLPPRLWTASGLSAAQRTLQMAALEVEVRDSDF